MRFSSASHEAHTVAGPILATDQPILPGIPVTAGNNCVTTALPTCHEGIDAVCELPASDREI